MEKTESEKPIANIAGSELSALCEISWVGTFALRGGQSAKRYRIAKGFLFSRKVSVVFYNRWLCIVAHQLHVFEGVSEGLLLQVWVSDQELAERSVDGLHEREKRRKRRGRH